MASHLHSILVRREFYDFLTFPEWIHLSELYRLTKPLLRKTTRHDTYFIQSCDQLEELEERIVLIKQHWPLLALGFSAGKKHNDQLSDLSIFSKLDELEISRCHQVQDLTPLKRLYRVRLNTCSLVQDLSPLKDVKMVSIESCHGITDISCLTSVQVLNIYRCFGATDVSNLKHLKVLSMEANNSNATILKGAGQLERLESVSLKNVGVESLEDLRTARKVAMYNSNLSDVKVLGSVQELVMHTARLVDVTGLGHVEKVDVTGVRR